MALTPEEEAALPANARQELFDLREENGQLLGLLEAAVTARDTMEAAWQTMQMQRSAMSDMREAMRAERDLVGRLRDRYARLVTDIETILNGGTSNAAKITTCRSTITTAKADLALIAAGG